MFIQVFQGRVSDAAALRRRMDQWRAELAPGAQGWLGATAGVTEQGEFISVVRFESEEAARRNSDRPEQGQWWAETAKLFDGEPTFHDCTEVDTMGQGGSDQAGFVQVIQGRTNDVARTRELDAKLSELAVGGRPDLIGGTTAWHGDDPGAYTSTMYFTSEAEAREGERAEMPPEVQEIFGEFQGLGPEPRYLDLRDPWLTSA